MKNNIKWEAEEEHSDLCLRLQEGLNTVLDPELGLSIIQLGMIRDVEIEKSQARIELILSTPYCPYAPMMIENTRIKAEQILEKPVKVELGSETWDTSMMAEDLSDDWGLYY